MDESSHKVMSSWERRHPPSPIIRGWVVANLQALIFSFFLFSTVFIRPSSAIVPQFDLSTLMNGLKVPFTTPVGSVIYKILATDPDKDYPLKYSIDGTAGESLVTLQPLACPDLVSFSCEVHVILRQPLEPRRFYRFDLSVSDTKGFITEINVSINATVGTPVPVFQDFSPTIEVAENQNEGTLIGTFPVLKKARENPRFSIHRSCDNIFFPTTPVQCYQDNIENDPVEFFYTESGPLLRNNRVEGELYLKKPLDYEDKNLYTILFCVMNAFTDVSFDTRNVFCIKITVIVLDRQDEPPAFINPPPVIKITDDFNLMSSTDDEAHVDSERLQ